MEAQKVTVVITVEALSIDSIGGLVGDAVERIKTEAIDGSLKMDDGDTVKWETKKEKVSF